MTRVLGLDLGSRRIGVALSDPLGITARGIETIPAENKQKFLERVREICREYRVEKIVLGLPKNMDGSDGAAAQEARQFKALLEKATGLPVIMVDERLTSRAAERALLEGDLSRAKRKQVRDAVAAALILQTYLDSTSRIS